jgi:tRNA(Ile)-lysidine synthase
MAARDLRYAWFNETMQSEGYNYIATAHHLGDEAETFFINLLRGTGISGLHGILPKQNRIIRPMLFTDKNEILEFLKENNLPFRHDASNDTLQYVRNKIRHTVIPQLSEINHSFLKNLKSTIEHLKDEEKIYKYFVEKKRAKVLMEKDGRIYISIKKLKKLKPLKTYLYEFLSPYGFNASVTNDVIRSLDEEPGKQFLSQTHKLIKDRQYLIIYDLRFSIYDLKETRECLIEKDTEKTGMPLRLEIKKAEVIKNFEVNKSAEYATLDYDRLEFPLLLRKWKHGDYFYPFGIGKKKKVSRLLIDKKLSIADKENVYVLCSGEKIAWVAGIRIDERFRITDKTKNAFVIRLIK